MYARAILCLICVCLLAVPTAGAQFAVIDVGAITQLIAQAGLLEDQLTTARDHLAQAQTEFAAITGGRGMERLLSGAPRNYLPRSWDDLAGAMQSAGGGYDALSGRVAAMVAASAVIPPQLLALLPDDVRAEIQTARRLAALRQNLTRQALATTSDRFASLQQLIDTIPAAGDPKAVLDLQARVGAETTMLQNEQSKLLALFQVVQAEEYANRQRVRERALVGHGQFATRFQPVP